MNLWGWRCRPLVGLFIPDKLLPAPSRTCWMVRHEKFSGLWLCDPYQLREVGTYWGKFGKAWRFPTEQAARQATRDAALQGVFREIPLP